MPFDPITAKLNHARAKIDLALLEYTRTARAAYPVGSLVLIHDTGHDSLIRAKVVRHGTGYTDFSALYVVNTKTNKPRKFYLGHHCIELISRCMVAGSEAAA